MYDFCQSRVAPEKMDFLTILTGNSIIRNNNTGVVMPKQKTHAQFVSEIASKPFVITGEYKNKRTKTSFLCLECGNEWDTTPHTALRSGHCPKCAHSGERHSHRWTNSIISRSKNTLTVDVSSTKYPHATMKIDGRDWERIKNGGRITLAKTGYPRNAKSLVHLLILGNVRAGLVTDHINRDKTDNRRKNLRLVDQAQNAHNTSKTSKSTSGRRGVCWSKHEQKWTATITINKRTHRIGSFKHKADAIKARQDAEKELYASWGWDINDTQNGETK